MTYYFNNLSYTTASALYKGIASYGIRRSLGGVYYDLPMNTPITDADGNVLFTLIDYQQVKDDNYNNGMGSKASISQCVEWHKAVDETPAVPVVEVDDEEQVKRDAFTTHIAPLLVGGVVPYHLIGAVESLLLEHDIEARVCYHCGAIMTAGYCIEGGCSYYCDEECRRTAMTDDEFDSLYDDGEGDSYYTEWDDEWVYDLI